MGKLRNLAVGLLVLGTLLLGGTTTNIPGGTGGVSAPDGGPGRENNIVLITLDDIGIDKICAFTPEPSTCWKTPFIDSLASQGIKFTRFTATPLCSSSRAAFLTGLHPIRNGVGSVMDITLPADPDTQVGLDETAPNVTKVLAANGYRTSFVGKWHLASIEDNPDLPTHPITSGFAHFEGTLANPNQTFTGAGSGTYTSYEWCNMGTCAAQTTYLTSYTTTQAVTQLAGSEPFFVAVSYNASHVPQHCPPDSLHSMPNCSTGSATNQVKAMIEALDKEIERLFLSIDLEDTTVILVSDNGTPNIFLDEPPFLATHGKNTVYMLGTRVPALMIGRNISASGTSSNLIHAADMAKTLLQFANISASALPTALDSISFASYAANPGATSLRSVAYTETFVPNGRPAVPTASAYDQAAETSRYRLLSFEDNASEEFYDLQVDPYEETTLDIMNLTAGEQTAYNTLHALILAP